jgi:hypothetical protein
MTTTAILDRVPVDAISERAQSVRPGRSLLTLVAAVLFGIGWVVAKVAAVAWLCVTWSWAATATGWEAAHGPTRGQQIAALTARVEALAAENRRLGGSG